MHGTYVITFYGKDIALAKHTIDDAQGIAEAYAYAEGAYPQGTRYYSITYNGKLFTKVAIV